MASNKPVIHAPDHRHGATDPVLIDWEDVGTGGGGAPSPDLPWAFVRRDNISLTTFAGSSTGVDLDLANGNVEGAEDGSGVFTLGNNGSGNHGIVINEAGMYRWSVSAFSSTTGSPSAGSVIGVACSWDTGDIDSGNNYNPFYAIPGGAPTYNFGVALSQWYDVDPLNVTPPNKGLVSIVQNSGLTLTVIVTFKVVRYSTITSPDFT